MKTDERAGSSPRPWRTGTVFCVLLLILLGAAVQTAAQEILLVYGAGKLQGGDDKLADHLLMNGYTVSLRADTEVTVADAEGQNLVILSDSVDSTLLGTMFREIQVPVLCAEHQQMDDLGLTGLQSGTDYGKASARQAVKITDSSNTLAAGLSGTVQVSTEDCPMGWGVPGENAVKVGRMGGGQTGSQKYALFEYEIGSQMPGLIAPAKRIGLLLSTKAWSRLTPKGQSLLDTAVDHAVRARAGGCEPCQSGEHKFTFKNSSGETLWVGVWDGVLNHGFDAPTGWADWKMEDGDVKTWCAPAGFNGRFWPRTDCSDETGTWKCGAGDCGGVTCSTTPQPASLAEINTGDFGEQLFWWDVSYVDGYNMPIEFKPDSGTCPAVGCSSLPACPWDCRDDRVCYAACKQYEIENPTWYDRTSEAWKVHAAVCGSCIKWASSGDVCGCANTCPSAQGVCAQGCGCSPYAAYGSWPSAKTQVAVPPYGCTTAHPCINTPSTACAWPDKYKKYAAAIMAVCDKSYTWTYHDTSSLVSCPMSGVSSWTVTFYANPVAPSR